ncbi:MAG TPA: sodium:calcium antiporter [Blastocatellia bacterium]|nr:sodium:calcium antiporter [Blastocatellia bacterium]
MLVWLQFIACTVVILFAGTKLSKYGDIIAEKTGLGRTWVGVALMASVTSLPELITGVSSVALFDLPNIAAGDALGSCMFNILIIALLDFRRDAAPISSQAHQGQALTAAYGIVLLGLVSMAIVAGTKIPGVGWIGLYSVVFLLIYLGAMRMVFRYEKRRLAETPQAAEEEIRYEHIAKARAFAMYALNAALVIGAATWLPHLGDEIAEMTGLGRTFVGSIFIAVSTSLPEVVVSFAALRIGAVDLAMGNLFGSNLFNIGILAVDDLLYTKGPLLSHVASAHTVTASAAIVMTAIAVAGLTYRASRKAYFMAWDSVGILAVYGVTTYVLYLLR